MVWDDNLDRMLGLAAGEVSRRLDQFLSLIHPDDRERTRERFLDCARGDHDLAVEFRVVRPDGSIHWLLGKGRNLGVPDGRGAVWHMTGACVDITERKRGEDHQQFLLAELDRKSTRM